ncbi:MAG: response regulator [Candidatus Colwellbacteria bacterium]|nr:response regulator [Candidatus Colwellbacteria bacterium]
MEKSVFIIEDQSSIIELYQIAFEKAGYAVSSSGTGREALETIKKIVEGSVAVPVVIVLDLLLPDISGLAVLGAVREKKELDKVLVVVLTNYVSKELSESMKNMPNVEYLSKVDISPARLIEIVREKTS